MRHTLEHIADPLEFLDLVRISNGDGGLIYIEVLAPEQGKDCRGLPLAIMCS